MHTGGEGGGGGHLVNPLKRLLKWLCIFGRDLTKQTLGTKIFSSTFSYVSLLLYRAGGGSDLWDERGWQGDANFFPVLHAKNLWYIIASPHIVFFSNLVFSS
jgi:hypothetical protein